jgi:4-hydroxybenzoyl-CoA reductase subunit beta
MSTLNSEIRLTRPYDINAAIDMRRQNPGSCFIAGGTDLIVAMRHGLSEPSLLIDLSSIDELTEIEITEAGIRIGAGASIATLARTPALIKRYTAVSEAAVTIAGPGHRVMGTVGGNLCLDTRCIFYNQSEWWRQANGYCLKRGGDVCHVAPQGQHCHAAFTGDLAPALLALDAEVEIAEEDGRRRIPLGDLYREDGRAHLTLAENALVVAVYLPPDPPRSTYSKVRIRGAIDYPLAGVAVALGTAGGVATSLRIGLTGTNSRPFIVNGTDSLLGRPIDEKANELINRMVQKQVQPMRTTVASAHYRRLAAAALACRLTKALFAASQI